MFRTIIFAFMAGVGASQAFANDTTAELETGGLVFTRSESISMEKERLFVSPTEVRVDYIFRNTGDQPVETYVAFPMPDIKGGPDMNIAAGNSASDNFLGFSVVQDGVEIKPSLQQRVYSGALDMTDVLSAANVPMNPLGDNTMAALKTLPQETLEDWQTRGLIMSDIYDAGAGEQKDYVPLWSLKSSYWWKTTFPVGKDISVSHTYHPSVGGTVATTFLDENNQPAGERFAEYQKKYCIDDGFVRLAQKSNAAMLANKPHLIENWISYVLTTGSNWAGPIKDFTLVIDKGDTGNFVSFCGTGVKKIGPTTFEMKASDFYPEKDLDILLLVPTGSQ